MPNRRFVKSLTDLVGAEFASVINRINSTRPEGIKIPEAAQVPANKRLPDSEIPFMEGDRVQIARGPDRGKVGKIISRYPTLGNAFYVAGVGVTKLVNPIEGKLAAGDQYDPVVDNYKVFDFKDLKLVSKIKNESNEDEDVVIDSVSLGPEEYDARSNTYPRRRFATHDRRITIPFPLAKAKPVESPFTTTATTADLRTQFVTSTFESPLPIGAVDQITNPNARFKRGRYAPKLTAAQIERAQPPSMPLAPRTKKLLNELAAMPKPAHPEFTKEIEDVLGAKIKAGLQKRADQEAAAFSTYQ